MRFVVCSKPEMANGKWKNGNGNGMAQADIRNARHPFRIAIVSSMLPCVFRMIITMSVKIIPLPVP